MRLASALAVLVLCVPARAEPPAEKAIDDAVAKSMKAWSVPGAAVVVVLDGKVHHLKGYGVREAGKEGDVTPDTLFSLGSCSKAFTTAAMAMLIDEGKLKWDDRVRDRLPTFRLSDELADGAVTLRDLVCHRTGLATNDLLWYRAPWSPEEGVERLAHLPLAKPFRTAFQYNSVTFAAAGLAAARADKAKWDEMIRKRLLEPLGMKRTVLDATAADKDADRARPHRLDRAGEPETFDPRNMRKPDPAGSIHSCARDMAAWLRFHLDEGRSNGKRLVSAEALKETHTPQVVLRRDDVERSLFPGTTQSSYAMAWVVLDHDGHKLVAHGGALDGQRAQVILVPEKKLGIAVLSNLHQTPMNVATAFALLDLYFGAPKQRDYDALHATARRRRAAAAGKARRARLADRQPHTTPSCKLSEYAGTYENEALGKVIIRHADGKLKWEFRGDRIAMEHFHYDTFAIAGELPGEADVTFALDDKGTVRRFVVTGHMNAEFRRK